MNDSNFKLTPDDPKLTAYALGELEGDERAAVEAALRDNPALRATVDEIRAMAGQLEAALAAEPAPEVKPLPPLAKARDPYARSKGPKLLRFPQIYFVIGGLAAACFAVLVAVRTPTPAPKPLAKHYVEVPLPPLPETTAVESEPATVAKVAEAPAAQPSAPSVALPVFDAKAADTFAAAKEAARQSPASQTDAVIMANLDRSRGLAARREAPNVGAFAAVQQEAVYSSVRSSKTWSYPADEGMVIEAKPRTSALPDPAATVLGHAVAPVPLEEKADSLVSANREAIFLSPFSVDAPAQDGYTATSTLAGSRVTTGLVPSSQVTLGIASRGVFEGVGSAPAPSTESYAYRAESDFVATKDNPLSTFSADVDTASYANVRRFLTSGQRPPVDAVRIEELLNYFPFAYAGPKSADVPFAATMEVAQAPWAPTHQLVRIGLKGREVATSERGAANLVFLLDVSGSMSAPNKLPLVKESMHLLLSKLRPDDRVAIVVYAGASGLALPSTPVKQAREIAAAIDQLSPGGSTNGAMGIHLAYDIAKANFIAGGINRVVLCTDGDFNVGTTSQGDLVRLIQEKAKSKVFLTALGFGMGNYQDATLQQIADAGNGHYGYVDNRREAEKLLVEQVNGTLVTIAKDVKLQVEFNPTKVASYRLIGYEKRLLKQEDFANDKVDAGEIGAGHTVTALYEIVPVGADMDDGTVVHDRSVEELRYVGFGSAPMTMRTSPRPEVADELLTLKVRFKTPEGDASKRLEFPLADRRSTFAAASADFKFAAAVAGFGMVLRDSPHRGATTLDDVAKWAESGIGSDPGGYRTEFVDLVKKARALE